MALVDTPGIGGSGDYTKKLIEYLPNALAFVFVINAASAGGMQNDRVRTFILSLNNIAEFMTFFKSVLRKCRQL